MPTPTLTALCLTGSLIAADGLPGPIFPGPLGVQAKTHCSDAASLQAMGAAGAKFFRRGFYWQGMETEKGTYDFENYDRLLADADAAGLRMVAVLFGNNKLHEDDGRGGIQTDEGRAGYAAWAAACAERYKDRGVIWEIWNEPNVRTFWRKDGQHNSQEFAQEYTDLVKATVAAMRVADPDCLVVAGSLSCFWEPSYNWTGYCFDRGMAEVGLSGWSVHPYGVKRPEDFTEGYAKIRSILSAHGAADLPLLNTERGFSLNKHFMQEHAVQNEGFSGGPEERAAEFQAWHVSRQMLIDRMNDIRITMWYEWVKDEKEKADFGLLTPEGEERPALVAYKELAQRFNGFRYDRRIDVGNDLDHVLVFINDAGEARVAAWTAQPEGATPEAFVAHDLDLPAEVSGAVEAVDVLGRKVEVAVGEGKIVVPLTGCPVYVSLPAAALAKD